MSESIIIAFLIALPLTITSIATLIVGIRNTRKTEKVIIKTEDIYKVTNSNLTKVTDNLEIANGKILKLEEMLSQLILKEPEKGKKK